jgi:hypothetical protein
MAQPAPSPIPATAAPTAIPDTAAPTTSTEPTTTPPTPTFKQRLDAAEHLWMWKLGLRALLILLSIIGIGALGWAVANPRQDRGIDGLYFDDRWSLPWTLITFGLTLIWCTICILVLLLRRPNRPAHPGIAVGLDLILWLGYIGTGMLALVSALSVKDFGSGGYIGYYSSDGYKLESNGTWVWQGERRSNTYHYYPYDYDDDYISEARDCSHDGYPRFSSCAEKDAYINALWQEKDHRVNVEMLGVACQFICLVLHFALFVWACVDTARRNKGKVNTDAEKLAGEIVMKMIKSGAIVPQQNNAAMQQPLLAHMQPQQGWGPSPPPQQGWPLQTQQPGMMGQPAGWAPGMAQPQPVVLGPEKGESSRFA